MVDLIEAHPVLMVQSLANWLPMDSYSGVWINWLFVWGCIDDLAAQVTVGLYQNEACFCTFVVQASFCGPCGEGIYFVYEQPFSWRSLRVSDM